MQKRVFYEDSVRLSPGFRPSPGHGPGLSALLGKKNPQRVRAGAEARGLRGKLAADRLDGFVQVTEGDALVFVTLAA